MTTYTKPVEMVRSWIVVEDRLCYKEVDKTLFKDHMMNVPKQVLTFFVNKEKDKKIHLYYRGGRYTGTITYDESDSHRAFLTLEKELFDKIYHHYGTVAKVLIDNKDSLKDNRPFIRFEKRKKKQFDIELLN